MRDSNPEPIHHPDPKCRVWTLLTIPGPHSGQAGLEHVQGPTHAETRACAKGLAEALKMLGKAEEADVRQKYGV